MLRLCLLCCRGPGSGGSTAVTLVQYSPHTILVFPLLPHELGKEGLALKARPWPNLWQHCDESTDFDEWTWVSRVLGREELGSVAGISEVVGVAETRGPVGFIVTHFDSSFSFSTVSGA